MQNNQERICRDDPATNEKGGDTNGMGTFFTGDRFDLCHRRTGDADGVQVRDRGAVPSMVMASFGLGLGVVLLGSLVIYAIPKKDK